MDASWWGRLTEGKLCLFQFSVDGRGCVPTLFDLRPDYGGVSEDNDDLLQKVPCTHCHTQCLQRCSSPLQTHASVGDSWILTAKSGLVSCGVTAPFSWIPVHKAFYFLMPSKSLFPQSCVSSVIKFHWPPKSNSLECLSPFAEPPHWEICCGP